MKKYTYLLVIAIVIGFFWSRSDQDEKTSIVYDSDVENIKAKNKPNIKQAFQKTKLNSRSKIDYKSQTERIAIRKEFIKNRNIELKAKMNSSKDRTPSSLESYFEDDIVTVEGREFKISQILRSISVEQYQDHFGSEVTRQAGYVLFEANEESIGQPALFHASNKSPVILTGRVLLKNISRERAIAIAKQQQVQLDTSMGHLGIYAFRAANDALENVRVIGSDISSAEIVEGRIHEK